MTKQDTQKPAALARSISLYRLIFYGLGTILGAGIFVVIGEVIGKAGSLSPLAYALAGLIAFSTALSYAEIAARIPTAGGPIDYVQAASGRRRLGSIAGWLLAAANTVSAATITSGFIGYLSVFVEAPDWLVATGLVAVLGLVAAFGMRASTWFMTVTTLIGIATLLAVLWALRDGLMAAPGVMIEAASGPQTLLASGLLAGAFLAIYSFIGFGDMALTAEEVQNVKRTMPRAIIVTLVIVFIFYLAISAALIGAGPTEPISSAEAPLVAAVERVGWPAWPVGVASLFVIVNGALTQIIGAARLLMDLGRDGRGAPESFGTISSATQTPLVATVTIATLVALLAAFVPLQMLAEATSLIILVVFGAVNISLFILKRQSQPDDVPDVWLTVPVLGALTSFGAMAGQIGIWISA